jgi:hypothetical protein
MSEKLQAGVSLNDLRPFGSGSVAATRWPAPLENLRKIDGDDAPDRR